MPKGLQLENVVIRHRGCVLIEIDHTIAPGDILSVMGPSGSGKSTLLSYIIGTLEPAFEATGEVLLDGQTITGLPAHSRRIGILFQDDLLFPHLSVGENLAFGLSHETKGRAARRAAVEQALQDIGLADFFDRDPATLSGGQKARVGLMRMLLSNPYALLLDEAFSRLDTGLREQIRNLVFDTARQRGLPVLMVTHDAADAQAAGGAVFQMGSSPSKTSSVS
ncbi:ATP-binding cassette domain-containing protein [Nereida sp. MMG025]|uniref:ATP-binding cassette domain-containing protein n=1 Tax=Nereida sp. MMG025 TaxID=2909981 RepID=UPI001F026392|nr:ATP-binding cassette domain-containing protein [Nereida sp. MMG025]MCF6444945.1 ATP-binding cassette domain-containing protein [Nereida sp. MMG025]